MYTSIVTGPIFMNPCVYKCVCSCTFSFHAKLEDFWETGDIRPWRSVNHLLNEICRTFAEVQFLGRLTSLASLHLHTEGGSEMLGFFHQTSEDWNVISQKSSRILSHVQTVILNKAWLKHFYLPVCLFLSHRPSKWLSNQDQASGMAPPNVKPKVIHYYMSKEKNFTLNQPWRLSCPFLTASGTLCPCVVTEHELRPVCGLWTLSLATPSV